MKRLGLDRICAGSGWVAAVLSFAAGSVAMAWDAEGHRIVTDVAMQSLPKEMPEWLRTPAARDRLEYLCNEPDHWRGQHNIHLDHANNPEHYLDLELIEKYGWTVDRLPLLRVEFTDKMAVYRFQHPDKFEAYDPSRDRTYTHILPGLLPYRIAEVTGKLSSSWSTLKTLEKYADRVPVEEIENARQNVIYEMGVLSHYVGDGSQPLHTTVHHHGWVGDNPNGYTTDGSFHAYIDGGVIDHHHITAASLRGRLLPIATLSVADDWKDICSYLAWTHKQVEPLYKLEKSGELRGPRGKRFIEDRLLAGGSMLAGLWAAAYESGRIDDYMAKYLEHREPVAAKSRGTNSTKADSPGHENGQRPAARRPKTGSIGS